MTEHVLGVLFLICLCDQTFFIRRVCHILCGCLPNDAHAAQKYTQYSTCQKKSCHKPGSSRRHLKHAQSTPNANPVHIAALYALSCASIGALSPSGSTETPRWRDWAFRTLLKTIVDTLRPIADPICVIAWKRAPATLCSCGSDILEMNSVPDAKVKSTPSAIRQAEGNPKAQYGALGSITAKKMLAHPVMNVPKAAKKMWKKRQVKGAGSDERRRLMTHRLCNRHRCAR